MKCLPATITILATLLLAAAAFAQTQPATAPNPPTLPTINCPDIERLIASIPANLWPAPNLRGQALIDQGTRFKAWSDANVKGQQIDFSMVAGVKTFVPSKPHTTVQLVNLGNPTATSLPCGGIGVVNNSGEFSIMIIVK